MSGSFRDRGVDVSRIEGLSDGVFGFAVTLLVVSLDVPRSFDQLIAAMAGVPAFLFSAVVLFYFWWQQHRFFRRYGISDSVTIALNLAFLIVILVYIYPLKFMLALSIEALTHHLQISQWTISNAQLPELFAMYAAGYAAISALMALMHLNAWRLRSELSLLPHEVRLTLFSVIRNGCIFVCSVAATVLGLERFFLWWTPFLLIAPLIMIARRWFGPMGDEVAAKPA